MSCSFLYEIRRKSEDFEQHFEQTKRENSNLSNYSKDEEIWEVPEETFDNVYHPMGSNDELEEEKPLENECNTIPEVFNLNHFESTESLHLSLNAKKIALKSLKQQCENSNKASRNTFQTVNKSINIEADIKKSTTSDTNTTTISTPNAGGNKVQWKNCKLFNNNNNNISSASLLNFSIVPINVSAQGQKPKQDEHKAGEKFPGIKLTSFSSRNPPLKPISRKTTILKPVSGLNGHTLSDCKTSANVPQRKSSSASEINKHITENSTSPESLLDNILSAASSVSVQSSSLSSNGPSADLDGTKLKQDRKSRESSCNNLTKNNTRILKTQIPELKIITVSNSPTNQQTFNVGTYPSPSLLTISNISHSDSFETASNRTRSPSASPLRNPTPKIPTEVSLYPDDLRCKICNELFKDPRSLNCLHSFCFQCIVNENFKQDASIPFWSQPQSIQSRDHA